MSDTGRLFVRNLSYGCTEDDLQHLFSKYGALVEVNLPIDKNSNKSIGYGFVTFMMPEHAVKAMSELDGSIFQGRILHLLPGKAQKSKVGIDNSGKISFHIFHFSWCYSFFKKYIWAFNMLSGHMFPYFLLQWSEMFQHNGFGCIYAVSKK